jgi:PRTRC genetic system protein E
MFETFFEMLNDGGSVQFTIKRKGGQLSVLIQPTGQGGQGGDVPVSVESLRAALATPLYVEATAKELDQGFPDCLAEFASAYVGKQSALQAAISRIKEGGKEAMSLLPDGSVQETGMSQQTDGSLAAAKGKSLFEGG